MVNPTNVSAFAGVPPTSAKQSRKIPSGPLYDKAAVLALVSSGVGLQLWTQKCIKDVQKLDWDMGDVCALIVQALQNGKFLGAEWCESRELGPLAACDAYSIKRKEWVEAAKRTLRLSIT